MEQNTIKLSVDTGSILVDIDDKGEIIGRFRFNPNDPDILKRYEKVIESLETINVTENADADEIFRISDILKEQINYLLNYNVSDELFAKCNPLTLTSNGDFYVENIIDGIVGIIERTTDSRLKMKRAKIQKATAKYHK